MSAEVETGGGASGLVETMMAQETDVVDAPATAVQMPALVPAPAPDMEWCASGGNYGEMAVTDAKGILMTSLNSKPVMNFSLENVAQCVIPSMNRNELEIQFNESDARKEEDCLVQITFHFPKNPPPEDSDDEDEEMEKDSKAELFQKVIMGTGAIEDLTGNVLVEFKRDEGNFLAPRSKFVVQVIAV